MDFNHFIETGKVYKVTKDYSKARSLVAISDNTIKVIKRLKIGDDSASLILVNGYEALREIIEAMTLIEGYKVFSHEAYTYYLKDIGEIMISEKFDRLRKLRNGVNYYGKKVDTPVAKKGIEDINKIIRHLKETHLKNKLP